MPTYDYCCKKCGYKFDRILKIADMDLPIKEPCPECGETAVERQITLPQNSCIDPFRIDGRIKHNDDFRETMRYIKKGNPGNNIKDY